MTTFTTTALRILHGGYHVSARDGILRAAVLMFCLATTLVIEDQTFALLAGLLTGVMAITALWELHDAGVECERLDDEDQDDEGETGFGTAA
ncbi:hypothetical protein [Nocardiopsis sp. NPDC006938]|uniref:hypothetical protein n=1 Tax=Nocardiopsis sp. NPDC006938 TaxID=3364337 RepID=UPI0036BED39D